MDILELQRQLDTFSSWRKSELMQAQFLAENSKNEAAKKYLCRTWVLIKYAHCDSFLKEASKAYINYLKTNINDNYDSQLFWLIFQGKEKITRSNKKYTSLQNYYSLDSNSKFDAITCPQVFEQGSFKYELLRFFCDWVLQIDYSHADLIQFCQGLKQKRDAIAHGEVSYVEIEADCLPWHHKTLEFIDSFKDSIILNATSNLP